MPRASAKTKLTPDQLMAIKFLVKAHAMDAKEPFYVPILAVGRQLQAHGYEVQVLQQSISHTNGLFGLNALFIDGGYFDQYGNIGLKEIGRAAIQLQRPGPQGRWRLLGTGTPLDLSPSAQYGYSDQDNIIKRISKIEKVINVELSARALSAATPPIQPTAKRKLPRL